MSVHNDAPKGKRCLVTLKCGSKFVDKFLENKSRSLHFEKEGWILKSNIVSLTIYRNQKF